MSHALSTIGLPSTSPSSGGYTELVSSDDEQGITNASSTDDKKTVLNSIDSACKHFRATTNSQRQTDTRAAAYSKMANDILEKVKDDMTGGHPIDFPAFIKKHWTQSTGGEAGSVPTVLRWKQKRAQDIDQASGGIINIAKPLELIDQYVEGSKTDNRRDRLRSYDPYAPRTIADRAWDYAVYQSDTNAGYREEMEKSFESYVEEYKQQPSEGGPQSGGPSSTKTPWYKLPFHRPSSSSKRDK